MEREQRGAKRGCSGTIDNLLIDRMVTQDCHRRNRNLSIAWTDVRKAYDSVSQMAPQDDDVSPILPMDMQNNQQSDQDLEHMNYCTNEPRPRIV